MNKLSAHCLYSLAALIVIGPSHAFAQFATPKIPAADAFAPVAFRHAASSSSLTVYNNQDDGPGSLRHTISNAAAGDTIQFALRSRKVIVLQSTLRIDKDLTILGPGPEKLYVTRTFASDAPSFRVIRVGAGNVTIAGMTILNGRVLSSDGFSDNLGGGIFNRGNLTVSNCVVTLNHAPSGGGGVGFGGGIFSLGPLTLVNSTVSRNNATSSGGGVFIFHSSQFLAKGSAVIANFAELQGGGVNFQGVNGEMVNCTISGNRTSEIGLGNGLLHIVFPNEAANLSLASCTIARNTGGSNAVAIAALPQNRGLVTRMVNTLVVDNERQNFFLDRSPAIESLGNNLDSDGTSGLVNGANGNIVGTVDLPIDAKLGPLGPNGGPTFTHALWIGSPALDAGACVDVTGSVLAIDQRGFPRPQGPACDIGAFENQTPILTCPKPGLVECSSDIVATVNDPDGDALAVIWNVDGMDVQTNFPSATHPPRPQTVKLKVSLAAGPHTVAVRVSDGKAPAVQCSSMVNVQDNVAPRIKKIKASPKKLRPADGRLIPVTLSVKAEDYGSFTCKIVSVRSNQRVGDEPDWIITRDLSLLLRAAQTGHRDRVYTITVECRAAAGNASRDNVTVTVSGKRSSRDDDDRDDDDNDDDDDDDRPRWKGGDRDRD